MNNRHMAYAHHMCTTCPVLMGHMCMLAQLPPSTPSVCCDGCHGYTCAQQLTCSAAGQHWRQWRWCAGDLMPTELAVY